MFTASRFALFAWVPRIAALVNTSTMTIPTTDVSWSSINTDLGYPSTQQLSLNDTEFRGLSAAPGTASINLDLVKGNSSKWIIVYDGLNDGTGTFGVDLATVPGKDGVAIYSFVLPDIPSGTGDPYFLVLYDTYYRGSQFASGGSNRGFLSYNGFLRATVDSSNNIYVYTQNECLIYKINASGEIWSKTSPNSAMVFDTVVVDDSGNIYISLNNQYNQYGYPGGIYGRIQKLDSSGNHVWSSGQTEIVNKGYGTYFQPHNLRLNSSQNMIYTAGEWNILASSQQYPAVFKYNTSGNLQWSYYYSTETGAVNGMSIDSSENTYITHDNTSIDFKVSKIASNGSWAWTTSCTSGNVNGNTNLLYSPVANVCDSTGVYILHAYLTGPLSGYSYSKASLAVTKLNTSGGIVYSRILTSADSNTQGMKIVLSGNSLIVQGMFTAYGGAYYNGDNQTFVFSMPKDGSGTWSTPVGVVAGNYTHNITWTATPIINGALLSNGFSSTGISSTIRTDSGLATSNGLATITNTPTPTYTTRKVFL